MVAAARGDSLGPMAYTGLIVAVIGVVLMVSTSGEMSDTAPSPCRGAGGHLGVVSVLASLGPVLTVALA